ncbi:hypothetical protein Cpir12675_004661 [Ceratocystis pirilliformis]|uniref:Uncharacterized protein n=1 Tax=Ceratocystis pirilliformis TaxID=259994 RepID=A0ABR3YWM5_9PEZI
MKFLLFLTFCCTIVFGAIIPSLAPDLKPSTAMADDPTGPPRVHKLLSRDSSAAYKEAKRAAKEEGVTLENGEYYYFMSCNTARAGFTPSEPAVRYVLEQTGCTHVALVVGKITRTRWTKKFEATYLNVSDSPSGTAWKQLVNDYNPRSNQKLIYGGQAVSSPSISALRIAGNDWLEQANVGGPNGGRQYSESMNCLNYYYDLRDMVSA